MDKNNVMLEGVSFIPASPVINQINRFLAAMHDPERFKSAHSDRSKKTDVTTKDGRLIFSYENYNDRIVIKMDNYDEQKNKYHSGTKKIFNFIAARLNAQAHKGDLLSYSMTIRVSELVQAGIYKDHGKARNGLLEALKLLEGLRITAIKKRYGITYINSERMLKSGMEKNGSCKITFNPCIKWKYILCNFTPVPEAIYHLGTKAFELAVYIFCRARMETENIAEKGSFVMMLRSVRKYLNLPDPEKTSSPAAQIRKPILKAIESINNSSDIMVKIAVEGRFDLISDFEDGRLIIFTDDRWREYYSQLDSKKKEKRAECQQKRAS